MYTYMYSFQYAAFMVRLPTAGATCPPTQPSPSFSARPRYTVSLYIIHRLYVCTYICIASWSKVPPG